MLFTFLSLKVSPQTAMSFKPITVTLQARIKPSHEIRSIGATLAGSDFARSSVISLDGENASPLQVFEWRNVPPGEYEVVVELYDQTNRVLAHETKPVRIIGQEGQ